MPLPRDQLPGAVFEQSSAHPERTWERRVTERLAASPPPLPSQATLLYASPSTRSSSSCFE